MQMSTGFWYLRINAQFIRALYTVRAMVEMTSSSSYLGVDFKVGQNK